MPGVRIVTDSTAYIPKEMLEEYNIGIVPLYVNFPDEVIIDGSISSAVFFDKVKNSSKLPFTSQPSPGDFVKLYEGILNEGYEIISIHISSGLSGTVESASAAKKMLATEKISVVDSLITTSGQALLVLAAAKAGREGKSREEIVSMVEDMKPKSRTFFVPDTLEYLKKGGRIGGAQALLGTILQIKPVLTVRNDDGKIDTITKVRTMKKALETIVGELPQDPSDVLCAAVLQAEAFETATALKALLQERLPGMELITYELSPVISTHTGPGVVGYSFVRK